MKKLVLTLLLLTNLAAHAAEAVWTTDLPKAIAQAKAEKKLVFVDFTGSDWCSACMMFHKQIATTKEFNRFAEKNLVLVEVDFPEAKPQTETLKMANEALKNQFKIAGYPTFVVLNGDGKEVWRQEGIDNTGPKPFIDELQKLKGK